MISGKPLEACGFHIQALVPRISHDPDPVANVGCRFHAAGLKVSVVHSLRLAAFRAWGI